MDSGDIIVAARQASAEQWRGEVRPIGNLTRDEITFWQRLTATRPELRSPFFSIEFAQAVADAGARARVCLLYVNGRLAGFFPFQFCDRLAQVMAAGERIGGALNDFCGVVIDGSRYGPISSGALLRCSGLASFEVSHLEEAQLRLGLPGGTRSQGARITLESGRQERYWADVKSAHPSDYDTLRRRERKVKREFRSVDFVFAHDQPEALLKRVVAEKQKQYERTGGGDGFAEPWKLRCLEQIARYREGRCMPVLSTLYLDDSWAAYHFGIRADNVLHYWFPVYNPRFRGLSTGLILLARMIREAANHAIDEIDLGEGLSRYKEVFATETYSVYRDVWHRASLRGLARRGYLSLLWRFSGSRSSAPSS